MDPSLQIMEVIGVLTLGSAVFGGPVAAEGGSGAGVLPLLKRTLVARSEKAVVRSRELKLAV